MTDHSDKASKEYLDHSKELGLDPNAMNRLIKTIEKDTAQGLYDGAVFIVARHGTIAMHEAIGHTDLENKRIARKDDVFHLMSATKQLTTVIILAAIDRGDFALTTPVREIIPEFGTKGKQNITVKHLLTHTSGLNTELPFTLPRGGFTNIQETVKAVSDERLFYLPGKMVSYNALTAHSILAEMVCRLDAANRPFRQILAEDLFKPLGMKDTSLSLRLDLSDRIVPTVTRYTTPGLFNPSMVKAMSKLLTEEAEFAAGGAIGTASDLFRFTEMLRRGGELDGTRILSPQIIKTALTNQTGSLPNHIFDYSREMRGWPEWPAFIGLSFFLRGEGIFPTSIGITTSPGTFSGQGAGSTLFWVDPERDLTFICLTAGLLEDGDNILRFQRLSDMVVATVVD
ncbi:serine hydrolase domain-containing protein [Thermodesulfobacteriota bacterium]